MRDMTWKQTAEVIGVVALVASLVFVGLQLRQAREIAVSSNDSAYVQTRIEVYNSINQYASIWISGNRAETLAEADAVVYRNLVRMLNESTFVDYIQQTRMGEPTAVVIMHDFAAFLHQNPGARRHWLDIEDNQIAYRNRLAPGGMDVSFWRDAIVAALSRLDQGSAQPLRDDAAVQTSVPR